MSDNPDLQRLAARYLDLWQEQVARMAGDPALPELMAKSYGMIKQRWDEQFPQGGDDRNPGAAPGATASPVPPADPGDQLALLRERLTAVEKRLDALERAGGGRGKRAAGGDKPRRSGKAPSGAV